MCLTITIMGNVAHVHTGAPVGFDSHRIEVECDRSKGLPAIQIVGMANKAIDEAKERIRSAIANSLLDFPATKLTINLAPAQLPKDGTHYDLPIAVSILVRSGQLRQSEVDNSFFAGELALNGSLRPVTGIVSIAEAAKKADATTLFVPEENCQQASLVKGVAIIGVPSLKSLFLHLKKEALLEEFTGAAASEASEHTMAIDDIHGQEQAKRALLIAAAGRHNILIGGPPGAGKTMLAKTLNSLLPGLSDDERLAVTKLQSLAGEQIDTVATQRPFRSPHHTASRVALIGGGTKPKPGEISLAHLGVLFLDEFPEYPRSTLEALRQPLEDKRVVVSRANGHASYPADFMLVATMNPCPCGYYGDTSRECSCSSTQILAYQKRLSGPLLDRIDLKITVSRVPNAELLRAESSQKTQQIAFQKTLKIAIDAQRNRYESSYKYNTNLTSAETKLYCKLSSELQQILNQASEKLQLSARSYFKVLKVARTIADLDHSNEIGRSHILEALQYR